MGFEDNDSCQITGFYLYIQAFPIGILRDFYFYDTICLTKGATSYELKSYSGLGHSVDNNVIQDVMDFLSAVLPHESEHIVPSKAPADMSIKELKASLREAGLIGRTAGFVEKGEFVRLLEEHLSSSK